MPARIRFLLSFVFLALAISTAGAIRSTHAATFFVDRDHPAANDVGPGTESEPYRTIQAAVTARGGAGNEIRVKPGTYAEQVNVNASGAAGSYFEVRATGPGVIIEGSDDFSSSSLWAAVGGGVFRAASVTWVVDQVLVDGVRLLTHVGTGATTPAGSFVFVTGEGLYVNVGVDPGTRTTLVGHRDYGFRVTQRSYVRIAGFDVRHSDNKGIFVESASHDVDVLDNTVSWARNFGIQLAATTQSLVHGNAVSRSGDHGIALTANSTGNLIRNNESSFNDRVDGRGANGIHLFGSPANRIEGNRLHDNDDSGLQINAVSTGVISLQNRSWNNGDHGIDHLNSTGAIHIGDVAYGNFKDGFSFESNSTGGRMFDCISVNNGIGVTPTEDDLFVDITSASGFVSDHNLIWNATTASPILFNGVSYPTVMSFYNATANEEHGLQTDPRFVNAAAGDFHLLAGSPAIDAGTSAPVEWPALDAEGFARFDDLTITNSGAGTFPFTDIGALEFQGGGPPPEDRAPVVTTPAQVVVREASTLVLTVTAADPDGDAITSFTPDLSQLPSGSLPRFVVSADNLTGTLTWTPTFVDSGRYTVSFTASNTKTATATTLIIVQNVDRAPVVTVPAKQRVEPGARLTFRVTASDPDGDAITSLTMDATRLPNGGSATFVVDATNTSGDFTWIAPSGQGTKQVKFTARNALSTTVQVNIQIKAGTGAEPLTEEAVTPQVLALSEPRPNPSRGEVGFALDLPRAADVSWSVYDLQGRELYSARQSHGAGRMSWSWAGRTRDGARAGAGLYLVRVQVEDQVFTRRITRF